MRKVVIYRSTRQIVPATLEKGRAGVLLWEVRIFGYCGHRLGDEMVASVIRQTRLGRTSAKAIGVLDF